MTQPTEEDLQIKARMKALELEAAVLKQKFSTLENPIDLWVTIGVIDGTIEKTQQSVNRALDDCTKRDMADGALTDAESTLTFFRWLSWGWQPMLLTPPMPETLLPPSPARGRPWFSL